MIGSGGFALATIGLCLLALPDIPDVGRAPAARSGRDAAHRLHRPARDLGARRLGLLGTTSDLRGFRDLEPFLPITVCLVLACTAWALLVGRGPLEWLVDRVARLAVPASIG